MFPPNQTIDFFVPTNDGFDHKILIHANGFGFTQGFIKGGLAGFGEPRRGALGSVLEFLVNGILVEDRQVGLVVDA